VLSAAPNQFSAPAASGQPSASASSMQFVPQMVNYTGVPHQFMAPGTAPGYGYYTQPVMHGAAVPAGFAVSSTPAQFSAANGTASGAVGVSQHMMAQPAAGTWSTQSHQVVNPFLVSCLSTVIC